MGSDQWADLIHVLLNHREVDEVERCESVVRAPLCSAQDVSGGDFLKGVPASGKSMKIMALDVVETCSLVLRMFIDITNCLDQPRRDRRCLNLVLVARLIGDEKAFPAAAESLGA